MKHDDIIAAAFRVWGREAYKKMSLTDVAAELGVTKPALYRHFKDKDQLLASMHTAFFDRYAEALKAAFPAGLSGTSGSVPMILQLLGSLSDFFGARPGDLAFMFARIMRFQDVEKVFASELAARGVTADLQAVTTGPGHNLVQMAVGSCFFMVALFHLDRLYRKVHKPADQDELAALKASIQNLAAYGLGQNHLRAGTAATRSPEIEYKALEAKARLSRQETAAPDGLLPAVAAVVAEVGSWNASMDMVAKRSGLSKSGLYSHFKSKEDMLLRLFSAEFERISETLAKRLDGTDQAAERLYLAMATAAEYLLARPDILIALDWLRMQRLGVPDLLPPRLLELFSFLDNKDSGLRLVNGSLSLTVRWILFLTIHQLMRCADSTKPAECAKVIPAERLRTLHQFMLHGLTEGVKL